MSLSRVPKWVWGLGIVAAILGLNAVMAFVNYVTASPSACLACHGTGGTPDMGRASAVHPSNGKVRCVDCHSRSSSHVLVEGYRGGFSADSASVSQACTRCHGQIAVKDDTAGFKFNVEQIEISHQLHVGKLGASCTDCHKNIAHDQSLQPNNRPRMEYCFTCHDQSATSCTKCHAGTIPLSSGSPIPWTEPVKPDNAAPPAVPHNLDGRSACLSCHGAGMPGIPQAPASHDGRTNELCLACHTGAGKGQAPTPIPPPATPPVTSTQPGGAQAPTTTPVLTPPPVQAGPPAVPHPTEGRSACSACHESGLAGATKTPASHSGRTNDMCLLCHQAKS